MSDRSAVTKMMHAAVNDCFYDLQQACADCGESLCAEGLADFLQDKMYDYNVQEYNSFSYEENRALALSVARNYA
jgi:hypothetical protein